MTEAEKDVDEHAERTLIVWCTQRGWALVRYDEEPRLGAPIAVYEATRGAEVVRVEVTMREIVALPRHAVGRHIAVKVAKAISDRCAAPMLVG